MEKITEVNTLEQFKKDMQRYAVYVTRCRMMPDYKDGLKEVQRKTLYSMFESRLFSSTTKSAAVVGRVIEKYHPHGDAAVYAVVKTLTNWFECKMPLIANQGSFGTIQGDPPAAARYTEIKLSNFAIDCFKDLAECKQAVDWQNTYDDKNTEPEYLPIPVPLLLINGSMGIGVAVKTEIPRHNLAEVIDATIALLHNPDAPVVLIPDHCGPCDIVSTNFKAICNRGLGSYTVRGRIDIDPQRNSLHIKSVPDLTFFDTIKDKIEELCANKTLIQIVDINDHTSVNNDLDYELILAKGADLNYVRDVIYKTTGMEQTCRVNFEVLDGINPMRMSYKSYLQAFIEFRKLTKFRMYTNKLQQIQTRIHQLETYITIGRSDDIDTVINTIRKQKNIDDNYLIEYLIKKFKLTDLQVKFIIGMDLKKLSIGYLNKYAEECKDLRAQESMYMNKIIDENQILKDIEDELIYFKTKYGTKRTSRVISKDDVLGIPQGEFKVVVTNNNFIKKIPLNDNIGFMKDDSPKCIIKGENSQNILFFDEGGKVFKLPIHKIPFSDKRSNGIDIRLMNKLMLAPINCVMYEPTIDAFSKKTNKFFLVVVTKAGYIKKMDLEDFLTVPASGLTYAKLEPGDTIVDIMIISDKTDIILYSHSKALRMNISDVQHLKRSAKGSTGMKTKEGIDGMSIISYDTTDIVVVTENGYINRFVPAALPCLGRAKTGSKVIQLNKSDSIKAIYGLNENDAIRIISQSDRKDVLVKDIPDGSSVSKGTKMISTKSDKIIKCSIIKARTMG